MARRLLGCHLCRRWEGKVDRYPITETEAYDGLEDRACHASRGRTKRTAVMFGPAGHWYVYLCYGMHWMLNLTAGPDGYPAAILIRGAGAWSGPGRLTAALHIDGTLNAAPARPETGLWIEWNEPVAKSAIAQTPRIGVAYAGVEWASRPWRFVTPPPKQIRSVRRSGKGC